jgi:hypothetical protein
MAAELYDICLSGLPRQIFQKPQVRAIAHQAST